jgi:hypothetical protein
MPMCSLPPHRLVPTFRSALSPFDRPACAHHGYHRAGGGGGLITNDVPLALPVPVSLSLTPADAAKERRLY